MSLLGRRQFIKSLAGLAVALPFFSLFKQKETLDLYPAEQTPFDTVTWNYNCNPINWDKTQGVVYSEMTGKIHYFIDTDGWHPVDD